MTEARTLYYAPTTNRSNNQWHRIHILPILEKMSKNFQFFNPLSSGKQSLDKIQTSILEQAKKQKSTLFFSLTTDEYLLPETIRELRNLGVQTVNFSCDNLDRLYDIRHIAPALDFCWVTEPEAVPLVQNLGGRPIYLPMAANPSIFKPYSCQEKYNLTFCGTKNGSRPWYIYKLLNIPELYLRVGGFGWDDTKNTAIQRATQDPQETIEYLKKNLLNSIGLRNIAGDILHLLFEPKLDEKTRKNLMKNLLPPMQFDQYIKLYSESKLSLGFNEKGNSYHLPNPIYQLRLRDFEAPMSGACYLTHQSQEMGEYFKENEEILFYSSLDELIEKAKYYLDARRDRLRDKMRIAARKRSLHQHTWEHRLRKLFSEMNIK